MRSAGAARLHVPSSKVFRAAVTARSMSSLVPSGVRPTSSSEWGEITSIVDLPVEYSTGKSTIDVISPHSEELVGRTPEGTNEDMDRAVTAARNTFDEGTWSLAAPADRIAVVSKFAELYAAKMMDLAEVITTEMG